MYKTVREDKTKIERGEEVVKSVQDRNSTKQRTNSTDP